jgi:N,N'-diacetylchitobiose transport system permease protein
VSEGAATYPARTDAGGPFLEGVGRAVSRLTLPVLLLLPALIIIVGLVGYPLAKTILLSFTETRLGDLVDGSGDWVGLENYKEVFTDDHLRTSLINTVVFGTACVIGTMVFGFAVALLLNQRLRGNWLFAVAVLLPWAVPALAASAIWRWLFDDRYGFVNWALVNLGFSSFQDYAWFADRESAYVAIFVTVVWQSFPFVALSLLAGLQTLPQETLHAASVDGATAWQRFRTITLPQLRPVIIAITSLDFIWNFNSFGLVYVLTEGGPAGKTQLPMLFGYSQAFEYGEFGYAAALGSAMVLVISAVLVFYLWGRLKESK